jgi:hypothetical protein
LSRRGGYYQTGVDPSRGRRKADLIASRPGNGPAGKLSKRLPVTDVIFREVQPTYDLD